MTKAKRYTAEQLRDAEKMAATLANVPEEKRTLVIMMTNSFMAGMEAQKATPDVDCIILYRCSGEDELVPCLVS